MTSESRSADDKLPDIVDIVRDMVEALSPALPAHLEQLADRARTYVEMTSSTNTHRAYAPMEPHAHHVLGRSLRNLRHATCRRSRLGCRNTNRPSP